ncbi:tyrosine recombinase XerD [Peptococcaceae bacterium CEB3]|nr:tyrosine recombinase XerD [Peptococcaceae bacterium CEB3]
MSSPQERGVNQNMSVKQRAENSWTIVIYLGRDENGEKINHCETYYARRKRDALEYEAQLKKTLKERMGSSKASAQTVGQLAERWLKAIRKQIDEATYETYTKQVKRINPVVGDIKLYLLTAELLEERLSIFDEEKLSPRTVKNYYSIIRTIINWGDVRDEKGNSIMAKIKPPKIQRLKRKVLVQYQLNIFIETAKLYKHYLPLRLLALGGFRVGEVLGLRWNNLDLEKGYLKVVESVNSRTRNEKETKTANSERTILLDSETLDLLAKHKNETCKAEYDFVFQSDDGEPLRHQVLFRTKQRILKRAGLHNIRIHDLRHGAGSILLDKGESLLYVAGFLGQNPATTAGIYGHATREGDTSKLLE